MIHKADQNETVVLCGETCHYLVYIYKYSYFHKIVGWFYGI